MIDQYIYTRLDSGGSKRDYGHGLAATTSGITGELPADISAISRYSNTTVDGEGKRVKIFEKRNLGTGHFAAFQQSVRFAERSAAGDLPEGDERLLYYSSTNRPQFLSHGYVCDIYDASGAMLDPDRWFSLPFVDYNVNLKQPVLGQIEQLPPPQEPLEPLAQVLEKAGLSLEDFITAVRASFDTENRDTIALIALDFTRPDAQQLGAQLLRWLFHFLPFAMRRQADFSTCYDTGCGGHDFALALIPTAMLVQERGGRITFRGMPSSAKYGYIFANGRCVHQKLSDRPDFDASGSLYALWLEQVIRLVHGQPREAGLQTLALLDQIYAAFDTMIRSQSDKTQCKTDYYDALCWAYLRSTLYHGDHIVQADDAVSALPDQAQLYVEALLSFEDKSVLRELVPNILDAACTAAAGGYDPAWLTLICRLRNEVARTPEVEEVLHIYLAKLFDAADEAKLQPALDAYFRLTAPDGGASDGRLAVLERLFFPDGVRSEKRWTLAGTSNTPEMGEKRAALWIGSAVTERTAHRVYMGQVRQALETAAGFTPEHLAALLDKEPFPAIDVTSGTFSDVAALVDCLGSLERTFEDAPDVFERISNFYCTTLKEPLLERCNRQIEQLSARPEQIIAYLKEIRSAFHDVLDTGDGATLAKSFQDKSLKKWLETAKAQLDADARQLTYLPDSPELHQSMVEELVHASKSGDPGDIADAYQYTFAFLMSESYHHRTKSWFEDAPDIRNRLHTIPGRIPDSNSFKLSAVDVMNRYLNSERQDYETFAHICKGYRPEVLDASIPMLVELFDRGELPSLQVEMLAYCAVRSGQNAAEPQKEQMLAKGLAWILDQKDPRALVGLLNRYPGAEKRSDEPAEEAPEDAAPFGKLLKFSKKLAKRPAEDAQAYSPRPGRYPWMETNAALFTALESAVKSMRALLQAEMERDELLCPDLIAAIFALAPPESQLYEAGRAISSLLNSYWEGIKPGPEAKKAMNELRKKGAFYRSR